MSFSNVLEIGKWLLIVILGVLLLSLLKTNRELNSSFEAYKKNGTYVKMYDNQKISELKKENRELYDSIKKEKNVKHAAIIEYRYEYNGDTVYISRKLPSISDSFYVSENGNLKLLKDSTYTYNKNNDSISYNLKINSKTKPNWYKVDFSINDKLTLINREVNGNNELTISTNGGTINGTQTFNKKENRNSFFNRFSYGIQVGTGYGYTLTNNGIGPGLYFGVGFGITYRLNSVK